MKKETSIIKDYQTGHQINVTNHNPNKIYIHTFWDEKFEMWRIEVKLKKKEVKKWKRKH